MSKIYTTEITSAEIASDNPVHQRLYKAYELAEKYIKGDVLEVGCGEGRGVQLLLPLCRSFTAVDKLESSINKLKGLYPAGDFRAMNIPPLTGLSSSKFDVVISFQVIEHIRNDTLFLQEIYRVLKPGGIALVTTPNRPMSLSRNPWHIREYTGPELAELAGKIFDKFEVQGIAGNEKVMEYYQRNKQSVDQMMRWDFLDLQHRLPAWVLRVPYEFFNRRNRNRLLSEEDSLASEITTADYHQTTDNLQALDLFLLARKN